MKTPAAISLAVCALLLSATPARAENECHAAWSDVFIKNDWEAAYQACLPLAEQGDAWAQTVLGAMYYEGDGVPRNYMAAYQWFSLAAAQGNRDAGKLIDLLEKEITPDQIAEAQKTSRRMAGGASKRHRINPTARPARAVFYSCRRPCYTSPSANPTGEASRATAE